ncbi:hypothetical protein MTR67_034225 [Solanum verrucosum]|uniref:Integrase catalytic domain-containing protein n=1 Tax=Solanum verrucosum TaxID=315347 RepID=A0AAF0U7C3_SOLVR|nr:hypothetical protein MTR67_034225 [Solanum verrucosum]
MWMELLKDYDVTIQYHPGKANVVADALIRKTVSMGSLYCLGLPKRPLVKEIQTLESKFMQLGISEKGRVLASIEIRPTFIEEIKAKQFEDESLNELRKKTISGKAQDMVLDAGGVLSFKGRICVPRVDDLIQKMLSESHVRVEYNAQQLAMVYVKEIVRLHGVPLSIISDHGMQFTSKFWGKLHEELGTQLTFSTAFHPQMDGQLEKTIQMLEDMLRSCVIDFGEHWDKFILLCEFSYNNSYHSIIGMSLFEALYEKRCRLPLWWFEAGDVKPLGIDLVKDAQDKVRSIQAKLLAAQSPWNKYANRKVRDMTFSAGEQVLLKVLPMKGVMRFGKKGKLSHRYIRPF